ncbi:MAG: polyhydroxybutyrate depolymerase [Bacteroidia bacterium]|jgi:polyhydroxybutyrate depolymerase
MFTRIMMLVLTLLWSNMLMSGAPEKGVPGKDVTVNIVHDGQQRSFVLHLPTHYDGKTLLPMLIGVHGYSGTGIRLENQYMQIFDHINEQNYIGIFPNGQHASEEEAWATGFNDIGSLNDSGPDGLTCKPPPYAYPVFENCPESVRDRQCYWGNSCADDLGFFRKMIEHMLETYSVDSKQIYMTGHSQGGSTINWFAAELQDLLAAVAPVEGFQTNGYARGAKNKLPFLQVWGRQDKTMPGLGEVAPDNLIYESAAETAAIWAEAQGCSVDGNTPYPTVSDGKYGWACTQHANCKNGSEVVTCAFDGEHAWPRKDDDHFGFDVVWDFFQKHQKP